MVSVARLCVLLLGACAASPLAACFTPRFVPRRPELPPPRTVAVAGGVKINHLSIDCSRSQGCESSALLALTARLGTQIEQAYPARDRQRPPVEADLRIAASWRSQQTFFFDTLSLMSFGLFPLVPQWGDARLVARISLSRAAQPPAARPDDHERPDHILDERLMNIEIDVKVPYTAHWYSWYRTDAPGRAFDDAWKLLADQIVERVGAHVGALPASTQTVSNWSGRYIAGGEDDEVSGETRRRMDEGSPAEETKVVLDRGSEWRFITRARMRPTPRNLFLKYLSAFSGLEAGYFLGRAWVKSDARDSFGASYTVASGQASSRGYRIGAYTIPSRSDWFIFPTLGFFSLDIDIHDFRESIPMVSVPGATEISAVGSDPLTGKPVDLGDPNVYRLELRSAYFGQRISGTLVYGTPQVQVFGTLEGGINLVEFRHTRVSVGNNTAAGYSAAWVRSDQLRGIIGIAIRPWHVAFRCEGNYEHYWSFSYPQELEFMGRVELNPAPGKQLYERRRTFVSGASTGTANVFFSANLYL